jgi:hypothetical protein
MDRSPHSEVSTVRMLRNKKPTAVSRGLKPFIRVGDPEKKYKISKGIVLRTTRGFFSSAAAIFIALFIFNTLTESAAPALSQRRKFRNSLIS